MSIKETQKIPNDLLLENNLVFIHKNHEYLPNTIDKLKS